MRTADGDRRGGRRRGKFAADDVAAPTRREGGGGQPTSPGSEGTDCDADEYSADTFENDEPADEDTAPRLFSEAPGLERPNDTIAAGSGAAEAVPQLPAHAASARVAAGTTDALLVLLQQAVAQAVSVGVADVEQLLGLAERRLLMEREEIQLSERAQRAEAAAAELREEVARLRASR